MKRLLTLAAAFLACCFTAHADVSYLLIQGPFGSGDTTETFKFQVTYPNASMATGQDLLDAVLGTPVMSGSYTDAYSGMYPYYTSTKGANGAGDILFSEGLFTESFTLDGIKVAQDTSYDPGWVYYVAGGSGPNADGQGMPGSYPNTGSWNFSNDGQQLRQVANGSFDGWVFGEPFENPTMISGTENAPVASNFAAAPLASVPEPDSLALLLLGGAGVFALLRRLG